MDGLRVRGGKETAIPGFENVGCAIGLPPAVALTNLGLMSRFSFTCSADGTLALGHSFGETSLTRVWLIEHREAGPDSLNVDSGPNANANANRTASSR